MKNIFLSTLIIGLLISCGSDDGGDSIIGDCNNPTSFQELDLSPNTVLIGWEQDGASSFIVEYGASGFTLGSGTQSTSTNREVTIDGLVSNTAYDYYIRAVCSSTNVSQFIGPDSFTTPECEAVDFVNVSNIEQTSVLVDWSSQFGTRFEVEYGLSGFLIGNGTLETVSNSQFTTLTNLNPGTTYDVYVRTVCGNELSDNSPVVQFTTLSACTAPTQFSGNAGGPGEVFLFWNEEGESAWRVEYGLSGFTLGTGTEINTSSTSLQISGLQTGVEYEFYVQANCGSDGFSSFVGPLSIVTN